MEVFRRNAQPQGAPLREKEGLGEPSPTSMIA